MINSVFQGLSLLITGDAELYFLAYSTLRFAALSVLCSAFIGIPLGIFLAFSTFPGRNVLIVLFNGSMAIPTVVIGLFVFSLFSRSGIFSNAAIIFTPIAVIVGQALFALPVVVSVTAGGLQRIDRRFAETLFTLGIRHRYLYAAREGADEIFHAVLTSFGRVVGEVGISMMLGGNIRWYTRTLTTAIVLETGKGNFELAMALGVILLVVAIVINAALRVAARHFRKDHHVRN